MTDVTALLDGLNPPQREAVGAPPGPVLVLAGAGSGKTRVLVHRAAWLMAVEGVSPYGLLAVTFTNKASGEMRARLQRWVDLPAGTLWIGTFHGLSHRLLRLHTREAGLPEGFQILDSDDQRRLVKRVLRALELDEARWPVRQCQAFINARKEEGLRATALGAGNDPVHAQMLRIYIAYEEACRRSGLVDFAELLLRSFELLRDHPALLTHYQQRFRHLLVDEFQDTNTLQYRWLRQLAGAHGQLFVVGDDDQSIYGWRGARADHLQRFLKDYPEALVVRLEQNYRSTATILEAANALIAQNSDRLGKALWTEGARGEPIRCYRAFNERDEADFV
ncbi:MAG: UvrD-helicase domain-containing protein, partial [Candidatus Macondimonas sp.]